MLCVCVCVSSCRALTAKFHEARGPGVTLPKATLSEGSTHYTGILRKARHCDWCKNMATEHCLETLSCARVQSVTNRCLPGNLVLALSTMVTRSACFCASNRGSWRSGPIFGTRKMQLQASRDFFHKYLDRNCLKQKLWTWMQMRIEAGYFSHMCIERVCLQQKWLQMRVAAGGRVADWHCSNLRSTLSD